VGPQANGIQDFLCPLNNNQIASPHRLCHKMDQNPSRTHTDGGKYWVTYFDGTDEGGVRWWPLLYLAFGGATTVHHLAPFPSLEQCGGI
jgi:hypothetical protein